MIAAHELAANAVRHGAGRGRVRLWVTQDKSAARSPTTGRRSRPEAAPWPVEHGHGLWLVGQIADQASWHSGPPGTVAEVSFRLTPPDQVAPFRLTWSAGDGCVVVTVAGELDIGSADEFAAAVNELISGTPGLRLVLDLAGLTGWDWPGRSP